MVGRSLGVEAAPLFSGLILFREVNESKWTLETSALLAAHFLRFCWRNPAVLASKSVDASGVQISSFTSRKSIRPDYRKVDQKRPRGPSGPDWGDCQGCLGGFGLDRDDCRRRRGDFGVCRDDCRWCGGGFGSGCDGMRQRAGGVAARFGTAVTSWQRALAA